MSIDEKPLRDAAAWAARGEAVAVATVVRTERSAPRPLGSRFVVSSAGTISGSVSGGCVEGDVVSAAQDILAGGPARLLEYGIADDEAWEVGLACGGQIWVWLEAQGVHERPPLASARALAVSGAQTGRSLTLTASGDEFGDLEGELAETAREAVTDALRLERSGSVEADDGLLFVEAHTPPPRLVIVGAVDTSEALAAIAHTLGWRSVIVDPRTAFATAERLPSADEIVTRWPQDAYPQIDLGPSDHVVVLTHDPKLDDPAIRGALAAGSRYVGALGSRRTQAKRRERLLASGVSAADLERVRGPVGLDIGALSPAETALAIAAEIVSARSGREGRPLVATSGRVPPEPAPLR
jgi:xanthine dehydrogenase accessory factor